MTREELYQGVWGTELRANDSRAGVVDDGNVAWPERIVEARRQWPQARVEDFDKVGKRAWRDKATGIEYRQEDGCSLLAVGTDSTRGITCFLVEGGRLVFLRRVDVPEAFVVHHGEVVGRELHVQLAPVVIQ